MSSKEKELPKIDMPCPWLAGTDISKELLGMYANYPVRLKCEVFAFVESGQLEVVINTNRFTVSAGDLVTLLPGTIFQICSVKGELKIYFLGFSNEFVNRTLNSRPTFDTLIFTLGKPLISIPERGLELLKQYFRLLVSLFEFPNEKMRDELTLNVFNGINKGISIMYKSRGMDSVELTKSEQLCRSFVQLVIKNYVNTRTVAWYARQLGVTHAHLCTVVKQVTGRTCIEVIASMVIMDAKSQLKSTDLPIQAIADSLHFANMSFFGKYFKRNVGMSPLEYRNNG